MTRIYVDSSAEIPKEITDNSEHDARWNIDNDGWWYEPLPTTPELAMTEAPAPLLGDTDMAMIPDLLARVANTIVAASSFAKDVERMRSELDSLSADLRTEREQAVILRETVASVTAQRDEAKADVIRLNDDVIRVTNEVGQFKTKADYLETKERQHLGRISDLQKERDEAQFANLELTDRVASLEAKLAKFKSIFEEDAPRPLAETPTPHVESGNMVSISEPTPPAPEPSPTTERRVYRDEDEAYWSLNTERQWDEQRAQYYRVA